MRVSISRRTLLRATGFVGLGGGLFACSEPANRPSTGAPEATRGAAPAPTASSTPTLDVLPATRAWRAAPRDVAPEVKKAAARLVESAGSWPPGEGGERQAKRRLQLGGYDPNLVDDLMPLITSDDTAATEVVVVQYGGILDTSASVLIVIDQWVRGENGRVRRRGGTLDVRLVVDEPQWSVTTVRPARSGRRVAGLTGAARRLLRDDRVILPSAAVRDIRSGAIEDSVLRALASLAELHRLDVSILRSGHPARVFGTDRTSDHTDGRAVDIWALDGRPIIERGTSAKVADFMRAAQDAGAYQVGGPVDLDGSGASFFSDDTHRDHIHLGFTG